MGCDGGCMLIWKDTGHVLPDEFIQFLRDEGVVW